MQNKRLITALVASSLILATSITAFAETTDTTVTVSQTSTATTSTTTTTDTVTTTSAPTAEDQKLANALAQTYNAVVTAQNVTDLHATGIGYGEISKAYGFAALSGKPVSDVLGMKQTMGWGEIAQTLGVKVSDVTKSDEAVQHAMNNNKEDKTSGQKSQNHSANSSKSGSGNSGSHGGGNGGGHGGGGRH